MQALMRREGIAQGDILAKLLQDKRSPNTRRAYERDVNDFFQTMTGNLATPDLVEQFLSMSRPQAVAIVLDYKAMLVTKGLAEATVNRRLAALRSLVKFARRIGKCEWDLGDVEGETIIPYRDVSGVEPFQIAAMFKTPDQTTEAGKRNYAILLLLWENALRRGEVVSCNVKDFDREARTLTILGKGRGTQKETITLTERATEAIVAALNCRTLPLHHEPLFIALSNAHTGHRLSGEAISYIVQAAAKGAGIEKKMSPHRMRHSSITAALEATNGNVAKVQKLSRHAKVETLMAYEDRRTNQQKEVSDILSGIA